ncbi:hypothetical protein [uncultured Ruegeria sp.]|uniref:hypothetical protein n=1 Tax=uncultured Ruegeria sp. TaxID=259304 RepID=UPI002604EE1E|nr:hypothetical protein [uncultured Ruegeria sp.]
MRQAKTRVLRTKIPSRLKGKRDGLFFLWGEIERARLNAEGGNPSDAKASEEAGATMNRASNGSGLMPVDEFIFY